MIESARFAEVQKYLSLTRHVYTAMPVMMSRKTWESLSDGDQQIIRTAEREARQFERKALVEQDARSLDVLRKSMQVNEVSPGEVERLRQKVRPVTEKFSREAGEAVVAEVQGELARLRKGS